MSTEPTASSQLERAVVDALRSVADPEIGRSVVDLGLIRGVTVSDGAASISLALPSEHYHLQDELLEVVSDGARTVEGVERVSIDTSVFTEDEQVALRVQLIGDPAATAGATPSHGHSEGRSISFADAGSPTRVLLVASGKGGVGKSSVTANLSIALAQRGHSVAVVDADVWGFSIPRMIGVDRPPTVIDQMIVPPRSHGVKVISMGFFAREDQPVIWRGPMLHKALEQFLTDVFWDTPDYLVVDLPPGTGDISLSLAQFLPRGEVIIVTTPQPAAQKVAQRAAFMAEKVNLDVTGVIENMSWFTGDDGKRYQIFGEGGGAELAERLEAPLIGQIPLLSNLREGSDNGRPIMALEPESEAGRAFAAIAEKIDVDLAPTKRYHPELKII